MKIAAEYWEEYKRTGDEFYKGVSRAYEREAVLSNEDNSGYIFIKISSFVDRGEFNKKLDELLDGLFNLDGVIDGRAEWGADANSKKRSYDKLLRTGWKTIDNPSRAGKAKAINELKKAIESCRVVFDAFMAQETKITTPTGQFVPPEKRGITHFVDYCIIREMGYGKDMLKKVYRELKK